MYKIQLDKQKACRLREIINADHYAYMYDINEYYKICTIMDRLEDVVEVLNNLELMPTTSSPMASDFISWINFADLLVNCILELNRMYVIPCGTTLFRDDNIKIDSSIKGTEKDCFYKYCQRTTGTDDLFFKFIRSLVLAHAIENDAKKFKCFKKGDIAYTPLVRWNSDNNIDITYYCPVDSSSKLNTEIVELEIKPLFKYVKNRFDYLDSIFDYIKKRKNYDKVQICRRYSAELLVVPDNCDSKLIRIIDVHQKLGDIDARNKADLLSVVLAQTLDIIKFNYSVINNEKIIEYIAFVNILLDELIKGLSNQDIEKVKLFDLFSVSYGYKESSFADCVYEINKISSEYDYIWKSYDFERFFGKVKLAVSKHVTITEDMSKEEKAYLSVIALGLEVIHQIQG